MTISAESIAKRVSERFMLVRLTPARYVSETLASEGSGVYGMTFNYPVARVERNGVTLTETASTPPGTNDHWYHNETDGTFKVKLASAPNGTTNVIVVYYYLFYTGHRQRTAWETPTDNTTPSRAWEPRLSRYPVIKQSIKNAISGVFSVQVSGLDIINTDYAFQEYLTDNDSFSQKAVDIWMGIDSTSNVKLVFSGRISRVSYDKTKVSLQVLDAFDALTQPAFMGDTSDEAYFFAHSGSFPDMYYADHGKPVPYMVGTSRVTYANSPVTEGGSGTGILTYNIDYQRSHKAVCTDYSNEIATTSTNRTWGLCRTSGDLKTLSFGTYTNGSFGRSGLAPYFYYGHTRWHLIITTNAHNLEPGDSFRWTHASVAAGANRHAIVLHTTPTVITCFVPNHSTIDGGNVSGTGFTFTANSAPAIAIHSQADNQTYLLAYELDFTVGTTTTSGGNKYHYIVLNNNFEGGTNAYMDGTAFHEGPGGTGNMSTLDPTRDTVAFRVTEAPKTHGTAMQQLLEAAGLTVDSASITAADSDVSATCAFSIPFFDETGYGPYRKYAEAIATATLGYVKLGSDGEVEYETLTGAEAGTEQTTHTVLRDTLSANIEYADVVTELLAENPHYQTEIGAASVSEASTKAQYLHGINNKQVFRHVLKDISGRLPDILALRSNRRVTYKFDNAVATINAELGEAATLTHPAVAGGDGTVNVKLITLDLNTDDISVEATDLLGL